jgi:hypothetical protein
VEEGRSQSSEAQTEKGDWRRSRAEGAKIEVRKEGRWLILAKMERCVKVVW